MSKRIQLSIPPDEKREIDWTEFFICQVDNDEALMSPTDPSDKMKSWQKYPRVQKIE